MTLDVADMILKYPLTNVFKPANMIRMSDISGSVTNDIKTIKKLDPKRQYVLLGFFVLLFVLSYSIGTMLSRNGNKTAEQTVTPTEAPTQATTTLTLSTASKNLTVGKPETVSVVLSKVPVSAADVVITYDPALLSVSNMQNGSVFTKIVRQKIDTTKIVYSATINPDQKNNLSEGELFTFSVTPKKAGTTVLQFDTKETITALNGTNTLGSSLGAFLTIQ